MLHKSPLSPLKKFSCKKCDYHCNNKKDFKRHLLTTKHKMRHKCYTNAGKFKMWICDVCDKRYSHHSSYYRHIKTHKNEVMEAITKKIDNSGSTLGNNSGLDLEKEVMPGIMETSPQLMPHGLQSLDSGMILIQSIIIAMHHALEMYTINQLRIDL